jgi:hypothetical protein
MSGQSGRCTNCRQQSKPRRSVVQGAYRKGKVAFRGRLLGSAVFGSLARMQRRERYMLISDQMK